MACIWDLAGDARLRVIRKWVVNYKPLGPTSNITEWQKARRQESRIADSRNTSIEDDRDPHYSSQPGGPGMGHRGMAAEKKDRG